VDRLLLMDLRLLAREVLPPPPPGGGQRLPYYARRFDTVEVDASYYRDPGPRLASRWADTTPQGFRFSLKMPKELLDPRRDREAPMVSSFLATARELGGKRGAILLQFPPSFVPSKHAPFLERLLDRLEGDLRYAVELRHAAWFQDPVRENLCARLRSAHIALAGSYPTYVEIPPVRTADFVYLRFIGDHTTVPSELHGEVRIDRSDVLRRWAVPARDAERSARDVVVYFNNHFSGFAPESVILFRREMGVPPVAIAPPRSTTLADFPPSPVPPSSD